MASLWDVNRSASGGRGAAGRLEPTQAASLASATHQQLAQVVGTLGSLEAGVLAQRHQLPLPHQAGQEATLSQALDLALGAWGQLHGGRNGR